MDGLGRRGSNNYRTSWEPLFVDYSYLCSFGDERLIFLFLSIFNSHYYFSKAAEISGVFIGDKAFNSITKHLMEISATLREALQKGPDTFKNTNF